jgi:type III restriction enzyme
MSKTTVLALKYLMFTKAVSAGIGPDFILKIDDGHVDPLNLIIEIKGKRAEDAKIKADTVRSQWLPAVNRLKKYGRWDFIEITDVYLITDELRNKIQQLLNDGAKQSA